jgi:hypothetical protein
VTDLEDIGDGNGVLGGLALGGDDGDGRPRHGGCCGRCLWLVSRSEVGSQHENWRFVRMSKRNLGVRAKRALSTYGQEHQVPVHGKCKRTASLVGDGEMHKGVSRLLLDASMQSASFKWIQ